MPAEARIGADARAFLERSRVGRLATADAAGAPHVVPVCYAVVGDTAYISIDEKPKSGDATRLKRLRNITANPLVALVVDHYEDADWSRLGWVMLRGRAEILAAGAEHDAAQDVLRQRYAQYRAMDLAGLPIIAIRVSRASAWGALAPHVP